MATGRRRLVTSEVEDKPKADSGLNSKIEAYCEQKNQESVLNKANKKLSEEIKKALTDEKSTEANSGKYSVHLETRVTESIDEVKMLSILKDFWTATKGDTKCPFICTAEYIDMNELEAFMYKENLPQDVMLALDGCRIKKESVALTYKIAKGEE